MNMATAMNMSVRGPNPNMSKYRTARPIVHQEKYSIQDMTPSVQQVYNMSRVKRKIYAKQTYAVAQTIPRAMP